MHLDKKVLKIKDVRSSKAGHFECNVSVKPVGRVSQSISHFSLEITKGGDSKLQEHNEEAPLAATVDPFAVLG